MQLKTIIKKFKKSAPIIVIGDPITDKYIFTETSRVSQEAPVLIVKKLRTEYRDGGALNVCNNIWELGGKSMYVHKIANNLKSVKTRVIANNQQLLRIDNDYIIKLSNDENNKIIDDIKYMYQKYHSRIIIISDYAKGIISQELFTKIINLTNTYQNLKVIIDPNTKHIKWYKHLKGLKNIIMVPNLKEYNAGCKGSETLVITKGSEGIEIVSNGKRKCISSVKKQVSDITGAGDTLTAVLGLCLNIGFNLEKSAKIANRAAGIVVAKFGTSTITKKEFIE